MQNNGVMNISRAVNGGENDRIRIEIKAGGQRILVELTPEEFGLGVTGLSERPCAVTFGSSKGGKQS